MNLSTSNEVGMTVALSAWKWSAAKNSGANCTQNSARLLMPAINDDFSFAGERRALERAVGWLRDGKRKSRSWLHMILG